MNQPILLRKLRFQGDAFKQIADTRAVLFCVEREPDLCTVVVSALTSRDPAVVSIPSLVLRS